MKASLALATLALALLQTCGSTAHAGTLDRELEGRDGWVAYRVPMTEDAGQACCFSWNGKHAASTGCSLDGRNWNFGTSDEVRFPPSDDLAVYLKVDHGRIERVRAVSATCPVKADSEIRWLDDVSAAQSIALLEPLAANGRKHDDAREPALAALAYHADPAATSALSRLAAAERPRDDRQQALFWLGQARGAAGADIVERWATTDADPEFRAQAVFALSQSKAGDPYARIEAISTSDRSGHVRSQALFWMAQMNDPRAEADILARVKSDDSSEVREQAVFALSQLKTDRADTALISIIEGKYPRDTKEKALFWLGQSGSQKALDYFDRVLAVDARR